MLQKIKKAFILLMFVFFCLLILKSGFTEIECRSQKGECASNLREEIKGVGELTFFNAGSKLDDILKENVIVEKYNFEFFLPSKIRINVIEKTPEFVVKEGAGKKAYLFDKNGVLLRIEEESDLSGIVFNFPRLSLGEKLEAETLFALYLTKSLGSVVNVKEEKVDNGFLEIVTGEGIRVYFPLEGDLDYLTGAFALIYHQLNKEDNEFRIGKGVKVEVIDLRFKNPVIKKVGESLEDL